MHREGDALGPELCREDFRRVNERGGLNSNGVAVIPLDFERYSNLECLHHNDPKDEECCSLVPGSICASEQLGQDSCTNKSNCNREVASHCVIDIESVTDSTYIGREFRTQLSSPPNSINDKSSNKVSCTIEESPYAGHDIGHKGAEPKSCVDHG